MISVISRKCLSFSYLTGVNELDDKINRIFTTVQLYHKTCFTLTVLILRECQINTIYISSPNKFYDRHHNIDITHMMSPKLS